LTRLRAAIYASCSNRRTGALLISGGRPESKAHLVAFATPDFLQSLELSFDAARPYFATLRGWTRADLEETAFYREHRDILDQPRGSGYWLWKPFIIRERLREVPEGDVVFYLDAGARLIADPAPLLEIGARRDTTVFASPYVGVTGRSADCASWTKRDCFVLMGCDEPRYYHAPMLDAAFALFRNGEPVSRFVDDWLRFCSEAAIVTDAPNTCDLPNLPSFADHRHDQCVLSLLAAREGLELFRAPSRRGDDFREAFPNSPYATLVDHHRLRTVLRTPTLDPSAMTCAEAVLHLMRASSPLKVLVIGGSDDDVVPIAAARPDADITQTDLREGWTAGLGRRPFNLVLCHARSPGREPPAGLMDLLADQLLDDECVLAWSDLEDARAFAEFAKRLRSELGPRLTVHRGTARSRSGQVRIAGVMVIRAAQVL
jgi:hypothetical protein